MKFPEWVETRRQRRASTFTISCGLHPWEDVFFKRTWPDGTIELDVRPQRCRGAVYDKDYLDRGQPWKVGVLRALESLVQLLDDVPEEEQTRKTPRRHQPKAGSGKEK